jgi:hypothetical protein
MTAQEVKQSLLHLFGQNSLGNKLNFQYTCGLEHFQIYIRLHFIDEVTSIKPSHLEKLQHYDVPLHKNDDNDSFDEEELLRHVPESQRLKAKVLINYFNKNPEQITWNSSGVIFIDQVSIPNSNIFQIFHCLFDPKCSSGSKAGLDELVYKLKSLHLDHLISFEAKKDSPRDSSNASNTNNSNNDELPWWFLG